MQRKDVLIFVSLLAIGLLAPAGLAAPPKEESVTLAVTCMT